MAKKTTQVQKAIAGRVERRRRKELYLLLLRP